MGKLTYEKAWDNKLKRFVTPSEVTDAERHDRNRYFSKQFDDSTDDNAAGEVLTLHKESKKFKNKNGTEIIRCKHFAAIGKNTKEYRERTAKLIKRQESLVHKLCKEVIKDIKYIKIPEVKACIMDAEYTVLNSQIIEINLKSIETKDKESGRIPDAIVIADILGSKQELYIEFLYAHEVDEQKRKSFEYFKKNCLEVNMYHLRDNLEDSEKVLKTKIKSLIENNCYWITNSVKLYAEKEALHEYAIEFNKTNILRDTLWYKRDEFENYSDWLKYRLFIFKNTIPNIDNTHPCYFVEDTDVKYTQEEKCTNIGDCVKCNNCIWISNYSNDSTYDFYLFIHGFTIKICA